MQQRFEENLRTGENNFLIAPSETMHLHREIESAGMWAAQRGMIFSGCGLSLSSGSFSGSLKNSLKLAGYGNRAFDVNDDSECVFTSATCPECKQENVVTTSRKMDGGTHVSGSCGCSKYYPE